MPRLGLIAAASGGGGVQVQKLYATTGTAGGDTNPNTSGAFAQLAGPGEIAIPAVAGDYVECHAGFLAAPANNAFFDLAIIKASSLVWFGSNATGTAATEGDPAMYPAVGVAAQGMNSTVGLTVTSTELDGSQVRFVLAIKAAGSGKTYYSSSYPFRWRVINYGPPG